MIKTNPPYYAVIFTSLKNEHEMNAYNEMSEKMLKLVAQQEGFLGHESYRNQDGSGVTISYWKTMENISNWKQNMEHFEAQRIGKEKWYASYRVRIAKIERDYGFENK